MSDQFTDLRIISLDDKASGPSGQGALFRLVLKLSESAPPEWEDYFNRAWEQHLYMMKRRASVSGDQLEIVCMPDELEKDHIPELNKVINETNRAYRGYLQERQQHEATQTQEAQRQREMLSNLKGRLKFD